MNRDWQDFKSINGNIAGAREAFENACESLFRKIYPDNHVSQVAVKQGDGGIDIFVGEIGIEPIIVIQCKFFLESFGESQKSQIRDSFKTAIESKKYELKEWILCIPRKIDIDDSSWWSKWKNKQITTHNQTSDFINLKNGNELIDLFKEHNLYNQVFKIEDSNKKITEIHKHLGLDKQDKEITYLKSDDSDPSIIHPTATIAYLNTVLCDAKELEDKYIDLSATTVKTIIVPTKSFQLHGSLIPNSFRVLDKNQTENSQTGTTLDSIGEALDLHQYFVLLGDPGSGKSTTLRKLVRDQAKKAMKDSQARIPVFINLAQWSSDGKDFLTFIAEQFRLQGITSVHIDRTLLLLDGLNEIAAQFYSKSVMALEEWLKTNPKTAVIISCREKHYLNCKKLSIPSVHVLPFDSKRIQLFLNVYLGSESAEILLPQLGSESSVRDLIHLAHNPYLLRLICFVYDINNKQLPQSRGDLFREFIKALYTREQDINLTFGIDYNQLMGAFSEIAFAMQSKRKSTSVHSDWAKKCVINLDIEDLWTLGRDANLLEISQDNRVLRFTHQLVLEYFAAEGLLKRFNEAEGLLKQFNELEKYISTPKFVNNRRKIGMLDEVLFTLVGLIDSDNFLITLAKIDPFVTVDCLDHTKKDFRLSDKLIHYLVNRFVSYFSDKSLDAKSAAIAKLEQLGKELVLEPLIESLQKTEDEDIVIKRVGLKFLSQYKNPLALTQIILALNDKNKWLRKDAEQLLLENFTKSEVDISYNNIFSELDFDELNRLTIKLYNLKCLSLEVALLAYHKKSYDLSSLLIPLLESEVFTTELSNKINLLFNDIASYKVEFILSIIKAIEENDKFSDDLKYKYLSHFLSNDIATIRIATLKALSFLKYTNQKNRANYIKSLCQHSDISKNDEIFPFLDDASHRVRFAALDALISCDTNFAVSFLDIEDEQSFLSLLKKLAGKQSLQFNNQKIAHSFSLLKITAIKSLTEKNETIPVDSLYRLLNDKYGDLRFVTLNVLIKYDKITIELITPLLNDKAKTVSKLAYDYLISKGVECEPVEIFFQNKPNV